MARKLRSFSVKRFGFLLILGSIVLTYSWIYLIPHHSAMEIKPCKIGKLNPWDDSLKPYLIDPPPLKCSKRHQIMFVDGAGYLQFNNTAVELNKLDQKSLKCVYSTMKREDGDVEVTFRSEVTLKVPMFVKSHVFRVKCSISKNVVYDYLHFNPFWNENGKNIDDIETESRDKPSLIIFGIDSVSRSHALRNLPRSYKFLREEFKAYDFEGYSKVGENTWPNLVPLLTGKSYRSFPLQTHLKHHVDSMPLIWNEKVVTRRFASYFAEDRPDISTFNFVKSGFKHVPTDFYFRPYTLGMYKFEPKIIDFLGKPSWDCYGVKNYFDIQIEYLKGFLNKYKNKRKFAYFWNNQVCHEQFTTLSRGDDSLIEFLKWMKTSNQTKNAIFVIISDHGYRIGGASLTHAGRAENNKPWLMIHVPEYLKKKYKWLHDNLLKNTQKLTTHYDMYQTMLDLVHDNAFVKKTMAPVETSLVRRNIFHEIPIGRTCADAGIEEKYCTCKEKVNISTSSDIVRSMAKFLVKGINDILKKHQEVCSVLDFYNVTEASVSYSNSDESNIPKGQKKAGFFEKLFFKEKQDMTGRYYILFHTIPGYAYFEGTVDFSEIGPEGKTNEMIMIGEPSRLDRYGNQSHCVQDSFYKLFCYCKDYKPKR